MAKGDEPEEAHQHRHAAGASSTAATIFAGNIMVLIAVALLFNDDEDCAESAD
jgi:preprotein translocase subunit SecD